MPKTRNIDFVEISFAGEAYIFVVRFSATNNYVDFVTMIYE
jgi:hypothetical protein